MTIEAVDAQRQRRAKRNAWWLALVAAGFYAAFILLSMSRAHG
jgi:hypothetical protein